MKNWTAIATFLFLMMAGGAAHSEGVGIEDIQCDGNPSCNLDNREKRPS
jgi:hypothetical protein